MRAPGEFGALVRFFVASLCRVCVGSVTGMLHNTTTLAPASSPVVPFMVFMYSAAGLGFWRGIVVLCRFWTGAMAPAPLPAG